MPLGVPIEFEPSLQEGNIFENEVDVDLISSPDEEVHRGFLVNRVEVLPDVVKAEQFHRFLRYGLIEALSVRTLTHIRCNMDESCEHCMKSCATKKSASDPFGSNHERLTTLPSTSGPTWGYRMYLD